MVKKFKVDDKVKVIPNSRFEHGRYAGLEGVIDKIGDCISYPYHVHLPSLYITVMFHANELIKL